jgi:ribonucleoside-triphosphate reductase
VIVTERFSLNPLVKRVLRERTPEFGFGGLGAAVYNRTYSRLKPDGSQETWADTVIRVVEGVLSIRKWWYVTHRLPWNEERWQDIGIRMADAMYSMRFLAPGRGLWAMGTDYCFERGSAALYNCLAPSEKIITREYGVVPISEIVGREVSVLTHEGWKPATINEFGVREVQRITFAPAMPTPQGNGYRRMRSNHRVVVTATPDHRWPLVGGEVTDALKVGDAVQANFQFRYMVDGWSEERNREFTDGYRHGLVFADGTHQHSYADGDTNQYKIRLCGEKTALVFMFEHVTYPDSAEGDPVVFIKSSRDLKKLPDSREVSPEYLAGFVDGWVRGDAMKVSEDVYKLSTQRGDAVAWLKDHAAVAGYVVTGTNVDPVLETNFGVRSAPLHRVSLSRREDVAWVVEGIEALDEVTPVYCATVPGVERFTLASGIYSVNCAYVEVTDDLAHAAEWTMDMLMCGVGAGHSARNATFELQRPYRDRSITFVVPDSREGWTESVYVLIKSYQEGSSEVSFDYSQIRAAGEPIRGFGGTASGAEPLAKLHDRLRRYLDDHINGLTDRTRLVTDVMNAIGACVVAGNVRRSAEIALGSPYDQTFLNLKNYADNPERAEIGWMSNNSIVLADIDDLKALPSIADLIRNNGEPGILNLLNVQKYGRYGDEAVDLATGVNPCSEIALESFEVCNLVEVFPTRCETADEYYEALELAQIYAHTVSLLPTHRPETNEVVARNRRIGESLSGIADWYDTVGATEIVTMQREGYKLVRDVNRRLARAAGVPESVRVTTVKPSGTISQLAGVSPGMHYPPYVRCIRRMRVGANTPIVPLLIDAGIPYELDAYSDNTLVFEFPVESKARRAQRDISMWQKGAMVVSLQRHWADNMVSNTITFDPKTEGHQIEDFLAFTVPFTKSISLLPDGEEAAYRQMPYEPITKAEYDRRVKAIRQIDWSRFGGSDGQDSRFCTNDSCLI